MSKRTPIVIAVVISLAIACFLASDSYAQKQSTSEPILLQPPGEAAQAVAEKSIRSIFKKEYSEHGAEARLKLARRLVNQAGEAEDDAAAKYVLLREARSLATDAGDLSLALEATTRIFSDFEINPATQVEMLRKLPRSSASLPNATLAQMAMQLERRTAQEDDFDTAQKAGSVADAAARAARSPKIQDQAREEARAIKQLRIEHDKAVASLEKLRQSPDDQDLNLAVGTYYCFIKKNWKDGLKYLAKGADATLAQLARKDLASAGDAAGAVRIGDDWWSASQKLSPSTKLPYQQRANYWYKQALPALTGLQKVQVQKRLSEISVIGEDNVGTGAVNIADWKVMCMEGGKWKAYPLEKMTAEYRDGVFHVVNTVKGSDMALLVYSAELFDGDFAISLQLNGGQHISLLAADGENKGILALLPVDSTKSIWHEVEFRRVGRSAECTVDGKQTKVSEYKTDVTVSGYFHVALGPGQSCSIRAFKAVGTK